MKILVEVVIAFSLWSADSAGLKIISEGLHSPVSDFMFKTLTKSANSEVLVFSSMVYWAFWGDCDQSNMMKSYVAGFLATSAFTQATKFITNRERPYGQTDRFNSSFPSGHTAAAFYVASFYSSMYPKYKVPFYIWATGVSISRVYLRRHWPTDVIAGAFIGFAGGKLFYKIRERF